MCHSPRIVRKDAPGPEARGPQLRKLMQNQVARPRDRCDGEKQGQVHPVHSKKARYGGAEPQPAAATQQAYTVSNTHVGYIGF